MHGIECAVPLAPVSPIVATDSIQVIPAPMSFLYLGLKTWQDEWRRTCGADTKLLQGNSLVCFLYSFRLLLVKLLTDQNVALYRSIIMILRLI
jgi:hypothetical protein